MIMPRDGFQTGDPIPLSPERLKEIVVISSHYPHDIDRMEWEILLANGPYFFTSMELKIILAKIGEETGVDVESKMLSRQWFSSIEDLYDSIFCQYS